MDFGGLAGATERQEEGTLGAPPPVPQFAMVAARCGFKPLPPAPLLTGPTLRFLRHRRRSALAPAKGPRPFGIPAKGILKYNLSYLLLLSLRKEVGARGRSPRKKNGTGALPPVPRFAMVAARCGFKPLPPAPLLAGPTLRFLRHRRRSALAPRQRDASLWNPSERDIKYNRSYLLLLFFKKRSESARAKPS